MEIKITQEMLNAVGELIEKAETVDNMQGIVFVTVDGGYVRIYNPELNQALKKRFEGLDVARNFAIAKIMQVVPHA